MSITIATLKAAGLTAEQIVAVLEKAEIEQAEIDQAKRIKNRDRMRASRALHSTNDDAQLAQVSPQVSSPSSSSPTPPITTPPPSSPLSLFSAVADATRRGRSEEFEEFWKAYPKREGANPKEPARKAFFAALKAGAEVSEIVAGARACSARDRDKIGTPYIPQAVKWLRDRRWQDYGVAAGSTGPPANGWKPGMPTDEELRRKYAPQASGISPEGQETRGDERIGVCHPTANGGMGELGKLLPGSRWMPPRGDDVDPAEPH